MDLSEEGLEGFFAFMRAHLDERQRRLMAGAMARALGRGGQAAVVRASKMSSRTVYDGTREVDAGAEPTTGFVGRAAAAPG